MAAPLNSTDLVLERFRAYLECLTMIKVDPRLQSKFGLSDIIQQTLLEACRCLDRISALDEENQKKWLRRMLVNNLLDEIDKVKSPRRDYRLERSLERAADESSVRLKEWLAGENASPSDRLKQQEESLRLLDALAQLPGNQRDALILQKWHGWTIAQIAAHLGRTTGAVAGLQARGLKRLRLLLGEPE
jgi:RNA polymerase sigma-70 factor (ECF subfamily)